MFKVIFQKDITVVQKNEIDYIVYSRVEDGIGYGCLDAFDINDLKNLGFTLEEFCEELNNELKDL